jgi:flagellin
MSVINTNTSALFAQNALSKNARVMSNAMEQLSTGKRINSAGDDAAGLAIGESMTAQVRGLNQAVRNANDGINLLQTAEGAMVEQSNMLQRMRELAVQSNNGTLSTTQQGYLQTEFNALTTQISTIASNTTWNGLSVMAASANTFAFQVGTSSGQTFSVTISGTVAAAGALSIAGLVISTTTSSTAASTAITTIDSAIDYINNVRATIGASINRLTYAADNLTNISQNVQASRSAIVDTDYATASTQLSRAQIVQQAATAMLAQANQQPQTVLALLK